jgi:glycosyltransferase involved in cell wall biosynthesis
VLPEDVSGLSRIKAVPSTEREQLRRLFAASDAFLCTSRYEGFGLAPAEALAAGIPIISPLVGGISDLLIDGENGIAVPNVTTTDFLAALQRFAALKDDAHKKMRLAAARSATHLTWQRNAAEYDAALNTWLRTRRIAAQFP